MKLLSRGVALTVLLAAGLPGQDLPPWVLTLARVKQHLRASFEHIPDYACQETVNRFERSRKDAPFRPIDTLHLEVASVGGRELYARKGAARFEGGDVTGVVSEGVIGSGAISATPRNLFVRDAARVTASPEEAGIFQGMTLRFDFEISAVRGAYEVQSGETRVTVGSRGTFWVDPQTLDLLHIEEHAAGLPRETRMRDLATNIDYARVRIGSSDLLLPQSAELVVTDDSGSAKKNVMEFTGCREYASGPSAGVSKGKKK